MKGYYGQWKGLESSSIIEAVAIDEFAPLKPVSQRPRVHERTIVLYHKNRFLHHHCGHATHFTTHAISVFCIFRPTPVSISMIFLDFWQVIPLCVACWWDNDFQHFQYKKTGLAIHKTNNTVYRSMFNNKSTSIIARIKHSHSTTVSTVWRSPRLQRYITDVMRRDDPAQVC